MCPCPRESTLVTTSVKKIVENEKEIVINSIYVGAVKGTKICKDSSNIRKLITEALNHQRRMYIIILQGSSIFCAQ
jgi:hypothetical protein